MDDDATTKCENCGRTVQPGTVHNPHDSGSCTISTDAQIERSEGMSRTERRL